MSERIAVVTGGARRLGREIVIALAREGFDIFLTYHRSEESASPVCQGSGCGIRPVRAMSSRTTKIAPAASAVPWLAIRRRPAALALRLQRGLER